MLFDKSLFRKGCVDVVELASIKGENQDLKIIDILI